MTTPTPSTPSATPKKEETNVVETVQSIILAFGIAMAARSFVTEGFFIPTGSMAPTLMGQHARLTGPFTGYEYPVDAQLYESVRGMLGANWRQEIEGMQNLRLAERKLLEQEPALRRMTREQLDVELSKRSGIPAEALARARAVPVVWPVIDPMISM
jgi:hypothetical protein